MKISILLPYKENFSPNYAGAVSLFVKDTVSLSKFKKKQLFLEIQSLKKNFLKIIKIYHLKNIFLKVVQILIQKSLKNMN